MSKEEFLKIQTCVLKVNIHCDGCKQKVKKILQKIDGVFTTSIDAEQGKVTVSGNVDPAVLIKKLGKSGKHAELWVPQKANNNQNHMANQLKNMQIDNSKGGGNNKGHKGNNNNNQPKGGQPNQQLQQNPQLQQLQQMKGLQDLQFPQLKGFKMPNQQQNQNQKSVKFSVPEDEDFSDDELDEFDDEDDYDDDDEFDDELDTPFPLNKMKPSAMPNGPHGLNNMTINGMHPQALNAQKGAPNAAGNGKKGGGGGGNGNGAVPVQVQIGGGEGKNGNGGKKGGGGGGGGNTINGGNQNQGGKNGGGKPQDGKNGNGGGGGGGGGGGNNMNMNGGKKGNNIAGGAVNDNFQNMGGPHGNMGQMGNMTIPMAQMGNIPAVQGLPASAVNGGGGAAAAAAAGGAPNGYFQGAGPGHLMPGNPYHAQQQQYLAAAMMNQQRAMGNERFQPMMYARPPPAVNYMPQYPYPYGPYPYPHPNGSDPYTNYFSDENPSSCNVM